MSHRLADDTREDRRARVWVGLGIAILLLSVVGNVFLGALNLNSQDNHHAATQKQQMEIIGLLTDVKTAQTDHAATLDEVKSLATAVNNVIAGLPAADTYLAKLAGGLETQIVALCSATHAACPPLSTASP